MNVEIDHEGHDESEAEAGLIAKTMANTEVDADADADALDEGEWINAHHPLYDMVSTPSVSGDKEVVTEVLRMFFEAHDHEVWIDEVGNVRTPADDAVLLTSHVGTVPDDVPVKVEDGAFWGRGSVDAIGPLRTMAAAAIETGVSFVDVVDEETSLRDARHLVEDREEPDAVVSGEPSDWDGVALSYRGFLSGTYISASELGHSSRLGENAIQSAVARWSRVADFFDEDRDDVFGAVTTRPVMFDGDPTEDGLVVEVTMDVQFRVPPRLSVGNAREVTESELTRGDVHWDKPVPLVMVGPHADMAQAFRVAIRNVGGVKPRPLRKTGTSDMNTFAGTWDYPMATCGPGDSDLNHAPDERLDLAEFDSAIDVLVDVCERLTGN